MSNIVFQTKCWMTVLPAVTHSNHKGCISWHWVCIEVNSKANTYNSLKIIVCQNDGFCQKSGRCDECCICSTVYNQCVFSSLCRSDWSVKHRQIILSNISASQILHYNIRMLFPLHVVMLGRRAALLLSPSVKRKHCLNKRRAFWGMYRWKVQ